MSAFETFHETAPLEVPAHARPGQAVVAVCDHRVLELRVVEGSRPDGSFTARAPRLNVREGLPVVCRVHDATGIWTIAYRIAAARVVSHGEAEIELVQGEASRLDEERNAPRAAYRTLATAQPVFFRPYDLGQLRVHTTAISRTSVAFESEREFGPGQAYDMVLDDEAGGRIEARVEVARVEPGYFGRGRVFTRIVAIDEPDRIRLDLLVSRALLRETTDEPAVVRALPLPPRAAPSRGRTLTLIRRRT